MTESMEALGMFDVFGIASLPIACQRNFEILSARGDIYLSDYSPDPTGDSPSDTAWEAAKAAATARAGGRVIVGPGIFKLTAQQDFSHSDGVEFIGSGRSKTIIDCTEIDNANGAFYGSGSLTYLGGLGSNIAVGTRSVIFGSAPNLSAGDVYLIFNSTDGSYNPATASHKAGEFFYVQGVSGATVTNTSPAFAAYAPGASIGLYKVNAASFSLKGMTMLFKQGVSNPGIKASFCNKIHFEDLDLSGSRYAHLFFDRCFDFSAERIIARDYQAGVGLNYGIVIANSQRGRLSGLMLETSRHGLSHGGGVDDGCVPYRDILIANSYINSSSDGMWGLDFHGNGEYCQVVNCELPAGCDFAADHLTFTNCKVWGNVTGEAVFQGGNALGNNISFNRCDFYATMTMDNNCLIQLIVDAELSRKSHQSFNDCNFYFRSFLSDSGLTAGILWQEGVSAHASCEQSISVANCKFFTDSTGATPLYGVALRPLATRGMKMATMRNNTLNKCGLWADGNIEVLEITDNLSLGPLDNGLRAGPLTSPSFTSQYWKLDNNTVLRAKSTGMLIDLTATAHRIEITRNKSLSNVQGGTTGSSTTDSSLFLRNAKSALVEDNIFGDDQGSPTQLKSWAADGCAELKHRDNEEVGGLTKSLVSITTLKYRGSATTNLSSISNNGTGSVNVTVPGVVLGDAVMAGCDFALPSGLTLVAYVTAADTVTVTLINNSGSSYDPPNAVYTVLAVK
jgi:hypothetical protein